MKMQNKLFVAFEYPTFVIGSKTFYFVQILAMLGEQFMVESELCGAVVSLRFQVWFLSFLHQC